MTDRELAAAVWAELQKTTISYPRWRSQGFTPGHWAAAKALLDQIGAAAPPPPPPPPPARGARSLPQGPFTDRTAAAWYRTTAGGTITKQRVHDTPDYGIGVMGSSKSGTGWVPPDPSSAPWILQDVIGERVGHSPPTSDGTAEAGLWLGQWIHLLRGLGAGTWSGAELVAQCCDFYIHDLTCAYLNPDGTLGKLPGTGLYVEHIARRGVIDGLTVRSHGVGVNGEWWYTDPGYAPYVLRELTGAPAGKAGPWSIEVRNFDIQSDSHGFLLDAGNIDWHIHDGVIDAPIGIEHPKRLAVASMPNRIDWETIDYRGGGTKEVLHDRAIG